MGDKAFGTSAGQAEVWLTLRAEQDADLELLAQNILHFSEALACEYSLTFGYELQDVFPATVNRAECARRIIELCGGAELKTPMRWSEDFGHYLRCCPGAYFGIGAGESCPPLHTESYQYPDALLAPTIEAFRKILFD